MKKIITVLAVALVIISCKKSEEGIQDKLGEIETLPPSQNGKYITLNGEITSFGIPTATEYGFLYAAESTSDSSLKFNDDGILAQDITNVPILYPTDKYIKYTTDKLEFKKYKYIAYIRNYKGFDYGKIVKSTVNDRHKKAPEIISISRDTIGNDTIAIATFKGIALDTIRNDSIKEVGFVISRISSFIPSEATKYKAITIERDTFKISFKIIDGTVSSSIRDSIIIINNTRYYARAYATYNTDSTFYSYNNKDTIVGKLPLKKSKGKIKTLNETPEGSNTILKGRITSFGKPASTEHGFLLTNEEFTKYSLVFNTDNKTTDKKIRIITITADIAGNIKYSSALVHGNYWYRAWIRNSSGVTYGDVEDFTK